MDTKLRIDTNALEEEPPRGLVLTAGYLKRQGACNAMVKLFRTHWPKGMPLTARNLNRAAGQGLTVRWAAGALFTPEADDEFRSLIAEAWKARCEENRSIHAAHGAGRITTKRRNMMAERSRTRYEKAAARAISKVLNLARGD